MEWKALLVSPEYAVEGFLRLRDPPRQVLRTVIPNMADSLFNAEGTPASEELVRFVEVTYDMVAIHKLHGILVYRRVHDVPQGCDLEYWEDLLVEKGRGIVGKLLGPALCQIGFHPGHVPVVLREMGIYPVGASPS